MRLLKNIHYAAVNTEVYTSMVGVSTGLINWAIFKCNSNEVYELRLQLGRGLYHEAGKAE